MSPILHRSLISPSKSPEPHLLCDIESTRSTVIETNPTNINANANKSPQYRPRHSYCHASETKLIPSNSGNSMSENDLNKYVSHFLEFLVMKIDNNIY